MDFTTRRERRGTAATKWEKYAGTDILPFWVADMEFETAEPILQALHRRVDHGILGYTTVPESLTEATLAFLQKRYGWVADPSWIVWLPGVVPGFNLACRCAGAPGDHVMMTTPVYYPFFAAPENGGRQRIEVPLVRDGSEWVMDFDALESAVTPATRLFLLCNPQNPTGRVYRSEELEALGAFAERHDLLLCSDEIHAELLLTEERTHQPIAQLSDALAARTITLMAPTKTFNIPGLPCAFAIIPSPTLRRRFREAQSGLVPSVGPLAYAAAEAAYRHGEPWRQGLLARLRENHAQMQAAVAALPGVETTPVEATCLAWLDVRALELTDPLAHFESHGLGLSPGEPFGDGNFLRLNFGCSPAMLAAGLKRLTAGVAAAGNGRRPSA